MLGGNAPEVLTIPILTCKDCAHMPRPPPSRGAGPATCLRALCSPHQRLRTNSSPRTPAQQTAGQPPRSDCPARFQAPLRASAARPGPDSRPRLRGTRWDGSRCLPQQHLQCSLHAPAAKSAEGLPSWGGAAGCKGRAHAGGDPQATARGPLSLRPALGWHRAVGCSCKVHRLVLASLAQPAVGRSRRVHIPGLCDGPPSADCSIMIAGSRQAAGCRAPGSESVGCFRLETQASTIVKAGTEEFEQLSEGPCPGQPGEG
jgi:hypothetical protein